MKNKITYICIFAILLTSLWGCSKYNVNKETEAGGQDTNTAVSRKYDEYTVLEVEGVCDTSSDAQHSSEYKFNISSEHVESEHKGQQKDFEILGIQVTGLYKKTESSDLDKNDRIIYEGFSADGNKITFGMDEETGQIRSYDIWYNKFGVAETKDQQECQRIAEEKLRTVVDDPENYVLERIDTYEGDEWGTDYCFIFYRMIGEVKAYDAVWFVVTDNGVCYAMYSSGLGELAGVKLPDSYNEEKVAAAVEEKVNTIYGSLIEENVEITHEIVEKRLIRLDDGSLGLYVDVDVYELYNNSGSSYRHSELIGLVVCLGE